MQRRLAIVLAVVTVVGTGTIAIGSSPAAGHEIQSEQEDPEQPTGVRQSPPDDEVASLAEDRGISRAEAERRLTWQASLPDLAERASTVLGDGFGGVWVDPADGDRVKLGVVGEGRRDRQVLAEGAVDASGLRPAADLVPVEHSYTSLIFASTWLGDRVLQVSQTTDLPISSGLRPDKNVVVLHLPNTGQVTPEMTMLVSEARDVLGDKLEIVHDETRAEARACLYPWCDAPLRAGIRIYNGADGGICTGGFLARSRTNNVLYQFTAGHCHSGSPSGDWVTRFSDHYPHAIGPVHNMTWSANGDMAIIRVDNPAGWAARAWVFVTLSIDTDRDESYNIANDGISFMGQRICTTGAYYGRSDCGQVTDLDKTKEYCINNGAICRTVQHLGRGSFCGTQGDSGAPMYADHTAFGLQVSGYSECDSLYQGMQSAEDLMNVNVSHEA